MDASMLHFDEESKWKNSRLLSDKMELIRFELTLKMVPDDVQSVLDVGAGNGMFLDFCEHATSFKKLHGIEYANSAINKKVCKTDIKQGSIDELPFDDNSIELVSALEVIEHLPVPIYLNGLKELARVSSKYVMISVPHKEAILNVQCPYCKCEFNPNNHVRRYDADSFTDLIPGFKLVELDEIGVKKELLIPSLRNRVRKVFKNTYPKNLTCPQCFYIEKREKSMNEGSSGGLGKVKTIVSNLTFFKKPKWYLALYIKL